MGDVERIKGRLLTLVARRRGRRGPSMGKLLDLSFVARGAIPDGAYGIKRTDSLDSVFRGREFRFS